MFYVDWLFESSKVRNQCTLMLKSPLSEFWGIYSTLIHLCENPSLWGQKIRIKRGPSLEKLFFQIFSCRLTTIIFEKQTHLWSLPQTNKGTCQIAFNTDIILEKTDANGIYGHFWYARLMMIIFVVHSILIFYWTGIFWVRIRHKESIFLVLQKMCRWNEQLYIVWDIHGH